MAGECRIRQNEKRQGDAVKQDPHATKAAEPEPFTLPVTPQTFSSLRSYLRNHLLEHVTPFWTRFALDLEHGGLFSCIGDDGTIQSRNKYIWSQARGLWTFSALYNRIEKRAEWLDIAHGLFRFLQAHGRDDEGFWVFLTDEAGRKLQGPESIVTDAFAIMGLVEYFGATGNHEALAMAEETYATVCARLAKPGSYGTAPYPTPPGMKAHREFMQFSLAFWMLGRAAGNPEMLAKARWMGTQILDRFVRPEKKALLEYIATDNAFVDTPEGRTVVPGHGLESTYFQILIFNDLGEPARVAEACRAMRWCVERGWDPEFGGLFLGVDLDGKEPVYWKNHEKKIWWVHAEALAGLLLAYEHCREAWCLEWYSRVHDWTFRHFPVWEFGEWTQRLDRQGNKVDTVVALPVKDPFHLQRALIVAVEALDRMEK
jgi:N-acylglucosamine 2-epimerase